MSLERLLIASLLAAGCYSNSHRDAPQTQKLVVSNTQSMGDLDKLCRSGHHSTKDVAPYLRWLSSLAGKQFDEKRFVIMPTGELGAFLSCGIPGVIAPGGIYWNGKIFVGRGNKSLNILAHELGHMYDPHLSSWDYVTDWRDRARMEAVSEAFTILAGIELIRRGNKEQGAALADLRHAPLRIDSDNPYRTGQYIAAVLRADTKSMKDVWYFIAMNPTDVVFERVERASKTALERGSECLYKERACADAEYKHSTLMTSTR